MTSKPVSVLAGLLMAACGGAAAVDLESRVEACAACHGHQGRSAREGYYPSIAGKPAGYLYQQLLNFRDGRRHHAVMQQMLAYLSDDYLREMAGYYAQQSPALETRQAPLSPEDAATGRRLALAGDEARDLPACAHCHGAGMLGAEPSIPGLLGLSPDYIAAQLGAWKAGVRKAAAPDCMADVARTLTGAEIRAISAWLAGQPIPARHAPAPSRPRHLPKPCGGVQ